MTNLDHVVVAANTLEQGVAYLETQLGVSIPKGGEHPDMGTHNHLLQLGNNAFLELISINPNGTPPKRPRWFGLDDPFIQARLKECPQLLTWVVNTRNLEALQAKASFSLGQTTTLSRGDLSWDFALPQDGRLLAGGILPYVMQWHTDVHPAGKMADLGCRLKSLTLHHSYPDWLRSRLQELGAADLVEIEPLEANALPYMSVEIETPSGTKVLKSS